MRRFKYVRLYVDNSGIFVSTPDQEVLAWILARMESQDPNARVKGGHGRYLVKVASPYEIYPEALRALCLNGWEPFAVTRAVMRGDEIRGDQQGSQEAVHLRLETE